MATGLIDCFVAPLPPICQVGENSKEMSRISRSAVLRAIKAVQEMKADQKLKLADEIFSSQPNLLGSVLVLRSLGVSAAKQEFAFEILLLCFQAMKESGRTWPLITEDEQESQMRHHTALLRFYASLDGSAEKDNSVRQFINTYPEQDLLAWVMTKTRDWRLNSPIEENDRYLLQAVVNIVNCIALVSIPANHSQPDQ